MSKTNSKSKNIRKTLCVTRRAFTLIEIMIVVLIIGILLAIAVPNYSRARETSYHHSCVGNLRKIQFAKDAYMMLNNKPGDTPAAEFSDAALYGPGKYLQNAPFCPGSGVYSPNDGNIIPQCNYGGGAEHVLD